MTKVRGWRTSSGHNGRWDEYAAKDEFRNTNDE